MEKVKFGALCAFSIGLILLSHFLLDIKDAPGWAHALLAGVYINMVAFFAVDRFRAGGDQ